MSAISVALTNWLVDHMASFYMRSLGTAGSGLGLGTLGASWGAAGAVQNMKTATTWDYFVNADAEPLNALLSHLLTIEQSTSAQAYARNQLSRLILALDGHVSRQALAGVTTFDSYLTYRNTGESTKWQCLAPPQWRDLPGVTPAINNLYFELRQGSTYANGLRKLVVGSGETAGTDVDSSKYAGGKPWLQVSGLTGSDTVTVTGTAYDPSTKSLVTGRTWTAAVTADGNWPLAPGGGSAAPADSLIVAVSGITAGGSIAAGTIYVEAWRPELAAGTSGAGAAATITLAAGSSPIDDYYTGLTVAQAADAYEERVITDYIGATRVATVAAWTSAPSTTAYRIWRPAIS